MRFYKVIRETWDTTSDYGGCWEPDGYSDEYFVTTDEDIKSYVKIKNDRLVLSKTKSLETKLDQLLALPPTDSILNKEIEKIFKELIHLEYTPFEKMDTFGWKVAMTEQYSYELLEVSTLENKDNTFHTKKV